MIRIFALVSLVLSTSAAVADDFDALMKCFRQAEDTTATMLYKENIHGRTPKYNTLKLAAKGDGSGIVSVYYTYNYERIGVKTGEKETLTMVGVARFNEAACSTMIDGGGATTVVPARF